MCTGCFHLLSTCKLYHLTRIRGGGRLLERLRGNAKQAALPRLLKMLNRDAQWPDQASAAHPAVQPAIWLGDYEMAMIFNINVIMTIIMIIMVIMT